METGNRRIEKDDVARLATRKTLPFLKHIMSPLEQAAFRHHYQPFIYNLNGMKLFISDAACKRLIESTHEKGSLLEAIVSDNRRKQKIPMKHRRAFDNPAEVLSLNPTLRNRLCRLECYTLFAIMEKGRPYFAGRKEFGKRSMEVIEGLFAKHKCSHLFR